MKRANSNSKEFNKQAEKISGAEFGTYLGADLVHNYQMIDEHFYEGISNLSGHDLDTLSNLASKIQDYKYDIWHGLAEKGIHKLAGHVGETYVFEHFHNAGIDVQWPDASNQAGWDLIAHGHEVNVKLLENADGLAAHFDKYPDIAVVISGDSSNIPTDAFHFDHLTSKDQIVDALNDHLILVDDSLSHADIMNQTSDATDLLTGSAHMVHAHIPWITMAVSGWREANLLLDSKTDMETAAEHIVLDVAGTAGGAFLGGKAGALLGAGIGSIFPGAGTVIGGAMGGIVGAISGAFGGRKISTYIKEDDFNTAKDILLDKQAMLQNMTRKEVARASILYEKEKQEKQIPLTDYATKSKGEIKSDINQLKKWRVDKESISLQEGLILINKATEELKNLEINLNQEGKKIKPWQKYLNPKPHYFAIEEASKEVKQMKNKLLKYVIQMKNAKVIDRASLFETIAQCGLLKENINKNIKDFESEIIFKTSLIREKVDKMRAILIQKRLIVIDTLNKKIIILRDEIRANLQPQMSEVNRQYEVVITEAKKLGKA